MDKSFETLPYDLGIVGGGLAGLSLAILQAKAGNKVILFEKNVYPFHRVCGEYISMESWSFLNEALSLELGNLLLPKINKLLVSGPSGLVLESELELGGFGISRYLLDDLLAKKAREYGVQVLENTVVQELIDKSEAIEIKTKDQTFLCKKAVGAFGKRSNLDINWKREFIEKDRSALSQFIGIKYHIKYDFPDDSIALHNFEGGYCGISAVEDGVYCLCYLTQKSNLKKANNDISVMEKKILSENPWLKDIFEKAQFLWSKPEVISQVSFEPKSKKHGKVGLVGDATGLIAPLCGNGMSMALHEAFFMHKNLEDLSFDYYKAWDKSFSQRLWVGRTIQRFFGDKRLTTAVIVFFKIFPSVLKWLISKTHGVDFYKANSMK
jgi:menaquinone-9 beta-reductase